MSPADSLALVRLAELRGVGSRGIRAVLTFAREHDLSLSATLNRPQQELVRACGLSAAALARLSHVPHAEHCHALLETLGACGAFVDAMDGASYPARWRNRAAPPPPYVYGYGNRAVLSAATVALLNSRTLTAAAIGATIRLVHRLGREHCTMVTGSMKSTYRIVAVAARAAGSPRAIVLDRGLFAAFPSGLLRDPSGFGPRHSPLDRERTLVLSAFRPHDHAAPHNGRRRDELIAALADVIIAVHARPGGEIERVCLRALDAGQCVLSWHGENAGLIAAGARSIDDSDVRGGLRRFLVQPTRGGLA